MKVYKPKLEIIEDEDEQHERRVRDLRSLTPEQLQRQQETARRHTRFETRKKTRGAVGRRAIRESMDQ